MKYKWLHGLFYKMQLEIDTIDEIMFDDILMFLKRVDGDLEYADEAPRLLEYYSHWYAKLKKTTCEVCDQDFSK